MENILQFLEITFGSIPQQIRENLKYLSYRDDSEDFICNPCNKVIQIVRDNLVTTSLNFQKHLSSVAHQRFSVSEEELIKKLNLTFQGKIPQIVQSNIEVLGVDGNDYKCSICDKIIEVRGNTVSIETRFCYHLKSSGHEEELNNYTYSLQELHNIYGGIPQAVMNHSHFLIKSGNYYYCKMCEKYIQIHPTSTDETEKSFKKHLHSLQHMRKAKQENAFSLIPQLKNVFDPLPTFMLRNIHYVSVNGSNFFCLLCSENIKFSPNIFETQQNFKFHYSSITHSERLNNRREENSLAFQLIQKHFDQLPASLMDNLRFLSIENDYYCCRVCHTHLGDEYCTTNLSSHFEFEDHLINVDNELERQSHLVSEIENDFGSLPQVIEENIKHIKYNGGNNFECLLCNKTMKSKTNGEYYETNTRITEQNFESHLNSINHQEELKQCEETGKHLLTDFENLFSPIPQFIMNNLEHLTYADDDFSCFLCNKTIKVVNGNKKGELTEQSFRTHLLSVGHLAKLKFKANQTMEAMDELQAIFNKVPTFVLSNIEHMEINEYGFFCKLCNVQFRRNSSSLEEDFRKHFLGKRHESNLKEEEDSIDEASDRIEKSQFLYVPEFLLRNIDFLSTADDNLFCTLCQEELFINDDDLIETSQDLWDHFESSYHQQHFKNL